MRLLRFGTLARSGDKEGPRMQCRLCGRFEMVVAMIPEGSCGHEGCNVSGRTDGRMLDAFDTLE